MPANPTRFTPPIEVQATAARGLELRRSVPPSRRGGTAVGVARARDLANGRSLPLATVRRMRSFFRRHAGDRLSPGWGSRSNPSRGYIAHLLWGGDAGQRWADSVIRRFAE